MRRQEELDALDSSIRRLEGERDRYRAVVDAALKWRRLIREALRIHELLAKWPASNAREYAEAVYQKEMARGELDQLLNEIEKV